MIVTIVLFLLAGLAEIGGGYLVWLWLREAKPVSYGIAGSLILVAYGVIPTFQQFPTFGRVYAFWGWWVDRKTPDFYDWLGALICLAGVSVMLFAPRS